MGTKKPLTKAQAIKKAREHLHSFVRKIKLQADDDPRFLPSIYRRGSVSEPCWSVQIPSSILGLGSASQIGASYSILISKTTGKIIFSGSSGE